MEVVNTLCSFSFNNKVVHYLYLYYFIFKFNNKLKRIMAKLKNKNRRHSITFTIFPSVIGLNLRLCL